MYVLIRLCSSVDGDNQWYILSVLQAARHHQWRESVDAFNDTTVNKKLFDRSTPYRAGHEWEAGCCAGGDVGLQWLDRWTSICVAAAGKTDWMLGR